MEIIHKKYTARYLLAGSFLIILLFGFRVMSPLPQYAYGESAGKMKGLCWVAGDSIGYHNIEQVEDIGANWISQTPFGWMSSFDSPEVILNNERAWWGETDKGISFTAELARKAGVKTMLKPHIWLRRSGDKWRQDIEMNSKEEWDQWFDSYGSWILHYARLAQSAKIEALCIGTELHQTTRQHPDQWRKIIKDIRSVYDGELIYAANWYKEYEEVEFWDDLDYIGIQAYFPLSKKTNPEKEELIRAWHKHRKKLEKVAKRFRKKIVFTEIGYKNTADAAIEPWTWPQDMDHSIAISSETQLSCYQAVFESTWEEPWFGGMFIWKWFHTTYAYQDFEEYFVGRHERRKARAKQRGRKLPPPIYFTPQRTEAIEELRKWYSQ